MALEIQSEKAEIDGIEFEVQQLPSTASKKLFERLVRAVGPALAEGDAGRIFATVFDRLSEKDSADVERILLEKAQVRIDDVWVPLGKVYELIFAGKVSTLYKLIGFALKVNYADFWMAVSGSGNLLAEIQSQLSSRLGLQKIGHTSGSSPKDAPPSPSSAPSTASTAQPR